MKYAWIWLLWLLPLSLFSTEHFIQPLPMKLGEKMVFSVKVMGMYVGDQVITTDKVTEYNGKTVIEGWGTSQSKRKVYYINDKELTYFDPVTLSPLYNERWVHQGDWKDRMWFYFYPERLQVDFKHNKGGGYLNKLRYQGRMNSFYTMIAYLRSLDYDWYISRGRTVDFSYLFGIHLKEARFQILPTTVKYQGQKTPAVLIKEIGGMGYQFTILLNADRVPYKLVIPGESLSFVIYLREFNPGSQELPVSL